MLNRWETVLAVLVLVLAINAGLFFFVYLPHTPAPPAAPLPEQTERTTLAAPPENTTQETTLEKTTLEKTTLESTTPTATATSNVSP
jgi:hypothetical protein